jgi:hypothetical protein
MIKCLIMCDNNYKEKMIYTELEFYNLKKQAGETRELKGDKLDGIVERYKRRRTKNILCAVRTYSADTFETIREWDTARGIKHIKIYKK